jgi:DNA invertase Pin-like site-specific DNA recombinase
MKIGYSRVSTQTQNEDRQIAALRTEGVERIFREKASGRSVKDRPQLEKAIDALGYDDVLVIAEWDRATRSMMDGIGIIQRVADRKALVKVLDKPWLDLTSAMGKGILAFLSALAEDERERIVRRANEGRQIAKSKGVKFGRKPALTDHQKALIRERKTAGESCRSIARDFNVSSSTISRI